MKKLISSIAFSLAATAAFASGTMNLQGTVFRTDTVAHYYFGPGMTFTKLILTAGSRTVDVCAATLDKADPSYRPEGKPRVEIGCDQCRTAESMTSMAKRKSTAERSILAGVNGDFFITSSFANAHPMGSAILGYPNMSCAIDGKLAAPDVIDYSSRENALIIGSEGMWIDATDLTYKILNTDGSTQVKAYAMNYPRLDNQLMVYNSYMGATTGTVAGGRELVLKMADGQKWRINATTAFTVEGSWSTAGNTAIPADGIVISCGKDYSNEFIDGLKAGDKVKLKVILALPAFENLKPDVTDIIGGDVRILNEGTVTTEALRWINTPSAKYARTACGYSQDRNKLVMTTVDGGTPTSSGLTYYETADLMAALGCYDALDLDGGGSTAMYMAHAGIVNKPRDGSERAIGNALFFALDAPADNEIASIRFEKHAISLPLFGKFTPKVLGYNKYGKLIDTDVKGFTIDGGENAEAMGDFVLTTKEGCFALKAIYNGLEATMPVTVSGDFPTEAVQAALLIDGTRRYAPALQAKVGDEMLPVAAEAFAWSSSDPSIVEINPETGMMAGLREGVAEIKAVRGSAEITFTVTVQIASEKLINIATDLDNSSWKITKTGIGTNYSVVKTADGWNIGLTVTNKRTANIAFAKQIDAYSLPDCAVAIIDANGGTIANVTYKLLPTGDSRATTITLVETSKGRFEFDLASEFDTANPRIYPIQLQQFAIYPTEGAEGSATCSLDVKAIGFEYDNAETSLKEVNVDAPGKLPVFISDGTITTPLQVSEMNLYTPAGLLVASAKGSSLAAPAASGIYLVRAIMGGTSLTTKIRIK